MNYVISFKILIQIYLPLNVKAEHYDAKSHNGPYYLDQLVPFCMCGFYKCSNRYLSVSSS